MARFSYIPNRVIDTNGISDGASLFFYLDGTTTPVAIYADRPETVPIANPVIVPAGAAVPSIYFNDQLNVRVRIVSDGGEVIDDISPYIEMPMLSDLIEIEQGAEAAKAGAETARDGAIAARVGAETARDTAVNAAVRAEESEEKAGLYADAAALDGPLYANEATGRAAVTDGTIFRAIGATDRSAIDIWRRDSSSASTLLVSYPSLDAILRARVEAWPMVFANQVMFADGEGNAGPDMLTPTSSTIADLYARIDATSGDIYNRVEWLTDIIAIWIYGQSLSMGTSGSGAILSPGPVRSGLRFSSGVRPQDGGSEDPETWGSFIPLGEQVSPQASNLRETIASGFVQRINERLSRDQGRDLQDKGQSIFCAAPGAGGATWQELSSPGTPWSRLTNSITKALSVAASAGLSIQPSAMLWLQGEANQSNTATQYYNGVKALWDAAQAHAQSASGSDRPLIFATYQTGNAPAVGWNASRICDGQLWLAERNQYGLFASPTYFLPYSDPQHLTPTGYKILGAYFADAIYDFIFNRVKRAPLRPVITRMASNVLKLTYPVRTGARLVIDDRLSTQLGVTQKQHGLRIAARADENVESPASEIEFAVALTGANEITLTGVVDFPEGETHQLRQVWHGTGSRVLSEIRDTAGDLLPVFDPSNINARLHNWLPSCSVLIP